MPKIQKTKQGLFVYLPKEYMQLLNWNKGDTLACFPDRSAKQTLVMQKTLDAVTKEATQSVNATREAPPVKIELTQAQRPQPQVQVQPRPIQQAQPQPRPQPTYNTLEINPERMRQIIEQRRIQQLQGQ